MTLARALIALCLIALAGCGGSSSAGREPVVDVDAPDVRPREAASRELEPLPTPTPVPPTPTPEPTPTPVPLAPPRGASITASAGTQSGAVSPFCWTAQRGGPSQCYDGATGDPAPMLVRQGEATVLTIDADRIPDEETIRAHKGDRSGYPSQRIAPARETELTIDLEPGEWQLDLCATWHGRGEPICWLFRLRVEGANP